eukprot:TRINITY_DN695_c0_g1_i1.p1 TRINITY_DN695_c0_g1~~TRINITY_DN695_c0_g1_i1.p1  ORF type:complete len:310 (+),score=49.34 TRINITY_DN695_c0_g1_i1:102-1031(+)
MSSSLQSNPSTRPPPVPLATVRSKLVGLEDTIIRALCERLQYPHNPESYQPGQLEYVDYDSPVSRCAPHEFTSVPVAMPVSAAKAAVDPASPAVAARSTCSAATPPAAEPRSGPRPLPESFLDWMLRHTERVHAMAGRFDAFDERPFFTPVPRSVLQRDYAPIPLVQLDPPVNFNARIRAVYLEAVATLCRPDTDSNTLGDAIVRDIQCLQAVSQRVHYGQLVMEAKAQSDEAYYAAAAAAGDTASIVAKLTDAAKEAEVIERVGQKAVAAGLEGSRVAAFYRDHIIPLTKEVEVEYMYRRWQAYGEMR